MSEELKPCPFCGVMPERSRSGDVTCINMDCWVLASAINFGVGDDVPVDDWNNRPIEDALRAENARLRERNRRLTWALRAIDARLHKEMDAGPWDYIGGVQMCAVPVRTLAQICNVAVAATAERAEGAAYREWHREP